MEDKVRVLTFGPFRLLPSQGQLWKEEERLEVRLRPLAVLTYLAQHPEQVVSIEEMRKAIWGSTYVSRTVIRVCIRELRRALGDEAATPHYIETVGRQGYRFIAPLATPPLASSSKFQVPSSKTVPTPSPQSPTPHFVGRERELAQLQEWFAQAQQGQRQLVFVSGDPGIGKTTLVGQFLAHLAYTSPAWIGHGQCVGPYGQGEAYLPLLEAVGRLNHEVRAGHLRAILLQHAPMWLTQLPSLTEGAERVELQRQVAGATQERMLRELCEALEVLTVERPIVLLLEDLQWCDMATLAWLAAVVRRPEPARLLMIGTYRPTEVIVQNHPLRGLVQELRAHRLAHEQRLERLNEAEVTAYVHHRLPHSTVAAELGPYLYQRTEGNPLFLVASLDSLLHQGVVSKEEGRWVMHGDLAAVTMTLPEDLQQLVMKQLEALDTEDQQLLEVASVSGLTFSTAEVAAGCRQAPETIAVRCEQLAQRGQFITEEGFAEWPDGTFTMNYHFRHALYQEGVYTRLGSGQKVRLHRLIGERREVGYGDQVGEIAGELALHFEQGWDYGRAVRYRQQAGENALRRNAYQEALSHLSQGLELLQTLPETSERKQQELALRLLLSTVLTATQGYTSDELEQNLQRALVLCEEFNETIKLAPVLVGLGRAYLMRADKKNLDRIVELEEHAVEHHSDPAVAVQIYTQLGTIEYYRGKHASSAHYYAQALTLYDTQKHEDLLFSFGGDLTVILPVNSSWNSWLIGYPDQAWPRVVQGIARAEAISHSFSLVHALIYGTVVRLFRREPHDAQPLVERAMTLAREYGFSLYLKVGSVLQGCIAVQQGKSEEGVAKLTPALAEYRATGMQLLLPFFLSFLVEAYRQLDRTEEGLTVVAEALRLTATTLDVFWEAELYRQKGELTLAQSSVQRLESRVKNRSKTKNDVPQSAFRNPQSEAEACFLKAIEVARSQGAKSLELRAVMNLVRFRQQQTTQHVTRTRLDEARTTLSEIYGWFTEGFDTKDLQEARALLNEFT